MEQFNVEFYEKENGEEPAKDFLLSQNNKMRAKLVGLIDILGQYGNQLREPYSKHSDDGIFEIRGKVGTDITRILYFLLRMENNTYEWVCKENTRNTKTTNQTCERI